MKKRKYPPHFKIRCWGISGTQNEVHIDPSKTLRSNTDWYYDEGRAWRKVIIYDWSLEYIKFQNFAKAGKLDEALKIFSKHHPETLTWPVRFIHIAPLETKREILA